MLLVGRHQRWAGGRGAQQGTWGFVWRCGWRRKNGQGFFQLHQKKSSGARQGAPCDPCLQVRVGCIPGWAPGSIAVFSSMYCQPEGSARREGRLHVETGERHGVRGVGLWANGFSSASPTPARRSLQVSESTRPALPVPVVRVPRVELFGWVAFEACRPPRHQAGPRGSSGCLGRAPQP
jgi:hypothetical protein